MVVAIRNGDDTQVETVILSLSRRNRFLAPLTLVVGAFAMLFQGVKLLFTNWRLTLIQVLPAMLIWFAMLDLKLHLLKGKSMRILEGPILIPIVLVIAALTAAAYFLNAVFAFSVADPLHPEIRPAYARALRHRSTVLGWGFVIGLGLGFATMVTARWGRIWFALILSIMVGVMMVTYVAVPARIIGIKSDRSRRDKLTATAIGGAVGAVVCSPPYLLGRVGHHPPRDPPVLRGRGHPAGHRCPSPDRSRHRHQGGEVQCQVGHRAAGRRGGRGGSRHSRRSRCRCGGGPRGRLPGRG